MVIEWLNKYYFLFPLLLLCIAVVKWLGASAFLHHEDGMAGVITLLFRWFSAPDYHVCDAPWQVRTMRLMNVVSLLFYAVLIASIGVAVLIKLFG